MKIILPILFFFFGFSSCQTYQYFRVSGSNISPDSSYQFVAENDTLWVQYNFNGYNGPVKISIYNKKSRPLYVNWEKSAIIIQGKAFSYYLPDKQISGSTSSAELKWGNGISTQSGYVQALLKGQEGMDFIPPYSMIERSSLFILKGFLNDIPEGRLKKNHVDGDNTLPSVRGIDFSREESPVIFRSYLTFSTSFEPLVEFNMEHSFYVSQILLSSINPSNFPSVQNQGNRFYTSRVSGFSKGVGVLLGIGLITGLAVGVGTAGDK